jgi:hypothetical protein
VTFMPLGDRILSLLCLEGDSTPSAVSKLLNEPLGAVVDELTNLHGAGKVVRIGTRGHYRAKEAA